MLTKDDLKQIKTLIAESFGDFFNNDLAPYLSKKFKESEEDHEELTRRLDKNDLGHEAIIDKLNKIELKVGAHELEIKKNKQTSKKVKN